MGHTTLMLLSKHFKITSQTVRCRLLFESTYFSSKVSLVCQCVCVFCPVPSLASTSAPRVERRTTHSLANSHPSVTPNTGLQLHNMCGLMSFPSVGASPAVKSVVYKVGPPGYDEQSKGMPLSTPPSLTCGWRSHTRIKRFTESNVSCFSTSTVPEASN